MRVNPRRLRHRAALEYIRASTAVLYEIVSLPPESELASADVDLPVTVTLDHDSKLQVVPVAVEVVPVGRSRAVDVISESADDLTVVLLDKKWSVPDGHPTYTGPCDMTFTDAEDVEDGADLMDSLGVGCQCTLAQSNLRGKSASVQCEHMLRRNGLGTDSKVRCKIQTQRPSSLCWRHQHFSVVATSAGLRVL